MHDKLVEQFWRRGELDYQLRGSQLEIYEWEKTVSAELVFVLARRGFGKTWLFLTIAFELMIRNYGWRMVYAAPTREQAKSIVIPTADMLIPRSLPEALKPRWVASEHAFVHPVTLSRLVIDGADDDKGNHLRGPFAQRVFGDEKGFWRHCTYVTDAVLRPQVQRVGGKMIDFTTPPESPHHEVVAEMHSARAEGAFIERNLDDDTHLSQAEKDEIARQYDPNKRSAAAGRATSIFQREYLCRIVTETERAVVPEFSRAAHVAGMDPPEFFDAYVWLDLGMVDLTHALFAFYHWDSATIFVQDEIVRQYTTVSELAPEIYAKEHDLWGDQAPRARISDAQPISVAEFHRQHLLQPALVPREIRFSSAENRNPEALLNRLRSMVAAGRIKINPKCTRLIAQLEGGLWNKNRTDFERISGLGHLDGIMALAYGVDSVDYATNPNLRKKLNPETHALYLQKTKQQERYGKLAALLHPATRGTRQ